MNVPLVAVVFLLIALIFVHSNDGNIDIGHCDANDQVCIMTASDIQKGVKIAKGANTEGRPPEVSFANCIDRHHNCELFERQGECEKNPGWMIVNCAKSCNACHLRDAKVRCQRSTLNISTEPIYKPGDMNRMFENIPVAFAHYGVNIISTSPWIITFDNFLTDEEVEALISTNEGNWERSTDSGIANEFGETGRKLSTGRTSSNAWCRQRCLDNPHVQNVMRKIEEITRVPSENYENFQVLRYEQGQRYNVHHDMGERQLLLAPGPRILTFFLYLSDVEEGGETAFPDLGHAVKPAKGRALLWPSVLDNNLEQQDIRTVHEARAVVKGVKYAANSWIHLYNYRKSNLWGCTGTFD